MICTVFNKSASVHVVYDIQKREISLNPGYMTYCDIDEDTYAILITQDNLLVQPASFARHAPRTFAPTSTIIVSISSNNTAFDKNLNKQWSKHQHAAPRARKNDQLPAIVSAPERILTAALTHNVLKDVPVNETAVHHYVVAVIVGGAERWRRDMEEAIKLLAGCKFRYFYVNDQIKSFPEDGVACTLHPDKLNEHDAWLAIRRKAGLPEPEQIWTCRKHSAATHDTDNVDWGGSSGLFAVQVALRNGYRKIILCGVPLTAEERHFERHEMWQSAISFRAGWTRHKNEISPYVRSMSGWTLEQFGEPCENWIISPLAAGGNNERS